MARFDAFSFRKALVVLKVPFVVAFHIMNLN